MGVTEKGCFSQSELSENCFKKHCFSKATLMVAVCVVLNHANVFNVVRCFNISFK